MTKNLRNDSPSGCDLALLSSRTKLLLFEDEEYQCEEKSLTPPPLKRETKRKRGEKAKGKKEKEKEKEEEDEEEEKKKKKKAKNEAPTCVSNEQEKLERRFNQQENWFPKKYIEQRIDQAILHFPPKMYTQAHLNNTTYGVFVSALLAYVPTISCWVITL